MATPASGVLPLTGDLLLDAMTNGYRWNNDGPITFAFSDGIGDEVWNDPPFIADRLEFLFSIVGSYIAPDFSFLGYFASPSAAHAAGVNINVSIDAVFISDNFDDNALAIGFFPNVAFTQGFLGALHYEGAEGDIFFNINSIANNYGFQAGQAGFSLALHEIGHALGLKHPHDSGGTGRPTFEQLGIEGLDIDWLTVMSYDDDFDWNSNAWDPATPMILDVIALQHIYGANLSTNDGDDTFELVSDSGIYLTIFDASGNDTLDLSNYQSGAYIDLPKYEFTATQYAAAGLVTTLEDRDRISFNGSPESLQWILGDIENVIGSPFGDLIDGSSASETIFAGGGFDEIYVEGGDDTVDGGEGPDWVYFRATFAESAITFEGDTVIVESELDGRNTLTNVESLIFDWDGTEDFRNVSALKALIDIPDPEPADDWRLIANDGLFFGIGGSGEVFGSQGFQHVVVLGRPGTISLDPSFNRGGDVLTLFGAAADWSVANSGSLAVFFDGDTFVQVPIGTEGLPVNFDDGPRVLRVDAELGQIVVGAQEVTSDFAAVLAPVEQVATPPGFDENARGKLVLAAGSDAVIGGDLDIFGTSAGETVTVLEGTLDLDPSFNQGGDLLQFVDPPADFTISLSGSSALLASAFSTATIPLGTTGIDLSFNGDVRTLRIDNDSGMAVIGTQEIGIDPMPLTIA